MGLESVEIVVAWEMSLGIAIPDEKISEVRTPAEAVELLATLVPIIGNSGLCLVQQAFFRVRNILVENFDVPRRLIHTTSRFSSLLPKKGSVKHWRQFRQSLGEPSITTVIGWPLWGPSGTKVEDACIQLVAENARSLNTARAGWTFSQLREIVHCSVIHVAGVRKFKDSDRFIDDIGID